MSTTRFLTGITTTGTPHLGNFVGSIRPSVAASLRPGVQSFYFLADYHALIKCEDPVRIQRSTLEIAASWLASGLDPEKVTFYRQSDIPEIPELNWMLSCVQLMKLAQSTLLRSFVAEHGTNGVEPLDRLLHMQAVFDKGPHDRGGGLRPQGLSLVDKGVHLFFHHVGGFADGANKKFGLFHDRQADFAHAETFENIARLPLNAPPPDSSVREDVFKAVNSLNLQ